jgi:hypothetical protein
MHSNESRFKVAVRARDGGRYVYQIFTVLGEPRTVQIGDKTYASPQEAEQAGHEAVEVLNDNLR